MRVRATGDWDQDVREAIRDVVEEQGEPMAVFLGDVP